MARHFQAIHGWPGSAVGPEQELGWLVSHPCTSHFYTGKSSIATKLESRDHYMENK